MRIAIVNVSGVLTDAAVSAVIPAMQKQIDHDFLPNWRSVIGPAQFELVFAPMNAIPVGSWPIFLNRHSADLGDLGWHADDGTHIYGRVFVGDCLRYNVSWTVDLTHEILETIADPRATKTYTMPNGDLAAYEVCDAVEDDALAYEIDGVLVSDFVLPAYFSAEHGVKYDFRGVLKVPCPALAPGGYMSIEQGGQWTQIQADHADGMRGCRDLMTHRWRRMMRNGKVAS